MKKLLTLVLGVVMLVAFAGLSVAQQKGVEKSQATGVKPPASGEKQKACEGYPQTKRCCKKAGGTWVEGGGGGFCYMHLRSATGVTQDDCRRVGGVVEQQRDGTLMCVPGKK
jgi:hypothetical protein